MLVYKTVWIGVEAPNVEGPEGTLEYMLKCKMFKQEQVAGMKEGDTLELEWETEYDCRSKTGTTDYNHIRVTVKESDSYTCNCCGTETPGEGLYDICYHCGWEQEPGEMVDPDDGDGGPNHMSLNEGRANFAQYGHYKCKKGCRATTCMCDW